MLDLVQSSAIPQFFLYGEPPRAVDDRFFHLEALYDRSKPNDWNIRPHVHANLSHIILIESGHGEMQAETERTAFTTPCLLLIPAGVVHAFSFESKSEGTVVTISGAYLRQLLIHDGQFADLFDNAGHIPLAPDSLEKQQIIDCLSRLKLEMAWSAPGRSSAVEANLLIVLVNLLRLSHRARTNSCAQGPHVELVARFRESIETHYRGHLPLEDYAKLLCVTSARLRSACLRATGVAPQQFIHDRIELEAKRLLIYSNMNIAELAFFLGFEDPAYFSRFFARRTSESPRAFRLRHQQPLQTQLPN
jgi:AraC family transcriptional regulator, transcriptional activator of pobA